MGESNKDGSENISMEKVELKKELGIFGGISLIIGSIVGSGIFISPKGVLDATGSVGLSLLVWVGAGLVALMGSLCYCELGTLMVRSGGAYTYIRKAYGDLPAFICIWVNVALMQPSSLAVMSLTFGTYFSTLFDTCGNPQLLVKAAGITCLVSVMLLNGTSVRLSATLQIVTTVAKTLALLIIIAGGLYKISQGYTTVLATGFEGSNTDPGTIGLAFYDALFAYGGWNNLVMVSEELKNPSKNIPRATIISVVLVIIIYCLTNMAYLTVMTKQELLGADAVAVLWGDRVLQTASIIIPLSVMVSTLGSINGKSFSVGRAVFAAARDGNLPEVLAFVNVRRNTPLTSVFFTNIFAVIFVMIGDTSGLIDFMAFTSWIFFGLTCSTIIIFRYRMKDAPRPYKVPIIIPILMCLISIFLVIAPLIRNPSIGYLFATFFMVGGAIIYFPLIHFKLKVPYIDTITTYAQLILEIAPTPKLE